MQHATAPISQSKVSVKKKAKTTSMVRLLKKYRSLYVILFFIMAYYVVFHYVPIVMGVVMSFTNYTIAGGVFGSEFVGFQNYATIFQDSQIIGVIINTLQLSVLRLIFTFWPPIVLAIVIFDLNNAVYKRVCQTIVYVPHFFSWVIIYGIVYAFFSANGFLNNITVSLGGERFDFLTSTAAFRPLIVGSQIWKEAGWGTILYFAALTSVNPELYEAAKIDGAGPLRRTMAITLPAMLPVITFSLIMALSSILNNDFEQILMFYNSAVYDVGDIIDSWVYRIGLGKMQYSIGSAVSLLKAFISLILIVGANKAAKRITGRAMW